MIYIILLICILLLVRDNSKKTKEIKRLKNMIKSARECLGG